MERQLAWVRLLADGEFHSGEAIAAHLGITRAAVWKALRKAADQFGLTLESVRGRGYRLRSPLQLLDADRIVAALTSDGHRRLARLDIYDQIDSTNAHLLREAAAGLPSGAACLAERQTAGRGRRGRVWVSPFGVNLYLSLLWRFPLAPAALGGMSLAAGAVVAETLSAVGATEVTLKWPNDLLWRRRKLAGLLLEVAGESQGPCHLVIGLGVNLRMAAGQGVGIDQLWATLDQATNGRLCERNVLAARLLDALMGAADRYADDGLAPFLDRWRHFDAFEGKPVSLLIGDRRIEGRHAGVANDGALRLETADGLRHFQAGEVSLRATETAES